MKARISRGDGSVSRLYGLISCFLALALVSPLRSQVGNDNPSGPAGIFNGNITTGCSYDPYTGNAMRKVTDITVAGAVGSYGLSFSRISNSRQGFGSYFGMPGAWQHSYGTSHHLLLLEFRCPGDHRSLRPPHHIRLRHKLDDDH
jgi:hypothetical protein